MQSNMEFGVEVGAGRTINLQKRRSFVTCSQVEEPCGVDKPKRVDVLCFDVETGRARVVSGDGVGSCAPFDEGMEAVVVALLEEFLDIEDLLGLQEVVSVPLRAKLEAATAGTRFKVDVGYRLPLPICAVYANRFRGYPAQFFQACAMLEGGWADHVECPLPLEFQDVGSLYDALGLDRRKRVRATVIANPWPLLLRDSDFLASCLPGASASLDEDVAAGIVLEAGRDPERFESFERRWARVRRASVETWSERLGDPIGRDVRLGVSSADEEPVRVSCPRTCRLLRTYLSY